MPDQQLNLLIVDDYEDNCDLLIDIFEDEYNVKSVQSGKECFQALEEASFDIVLLDVNMPEMDGYEVCRRLKQSQDTAAMPVVFVSALASTEERLKGYEMGAEDYITKPFKGPQIKETVAKILEQRVQTKNIEKQSQEAMSTAFQAMTNSAEMGNIIQFMQASYGCKTVERLAERLLETLQGFNLNCCLMFRMDYQTSFSGCSLDSIEAKVLDRFHSAERITDFGARTLINEEHVSLLVKNMPLNKPDDYGRIKDNLTALIAGTEARCKALGVEYQLEFERNRGLQTVLLKSQNQLKEIDDLIEKQKENTNHVFMSINEKVESIIFSLGLDETQEHAILAAMDKGVEELGRLTEYSDHIANNFHNFVADLNKLVD